MIYNILFTPEQRVFLRRPSSRWQERPRKSLNRHRSNIGIIGACMTTRSETSSFSYSKTTMTFELGPSSPIDVIKAFIVTFGSKTTDTITSIALPWKEQYAKGVLRQYPSGVNFDMRQVSHWGSKFPSLKKMRLIYPQIKCYVRSNSRPIEAPAAMQCAAGFLNKTRLLIESEETAVYIQDEYNDYVTPNGERLGPSVHEIVIHRMTFGRGDVCLLVMVPFDEDSWRIAEVCM